MADDLLNAFWANPMLANIALPGSRIKVRPDATAEDFVDGRVAVAEGVKLGYRFFPLPPSKRHATAPLIVHFHGNGEVCIWLCNCVHAHVYV
mgnify:CR=1 FL=1